MTPTLSVLIAHIVEREETYKRLRTCLDRQLPPSGEVEVLVETDNRELTRGHKRDILIKRAKGKYACVIDDDDMVLDTYISSILSAIRSKPGVDCVGIRGIVSWNWEHFSIFERSPRAAGMFLKDPEGIFCLPTGPLNPVSRRIYSSTDFDKTRNRCEDDAWVAAIRPKIHTSVLITRPIYLYWGAGDYFLGRPKVMPP